MKNPLKTIDDTVLYAANKAVHAYNWTTGGTKSELANAFLNSGAIIELVTSYGLHVFSNLLYVPLLNKQNIEMDARDNGLKDLGVENLKLARSLVGYVFLGASIHFYFSSRDPKNESYETMILAGTSCSFLLKGISCQLMRADYLPPRKDCVRRSLDKLSEMVEEYKERRTLLPQRVRVR